MSKGIGFSTEVRSIDTKKVEETRTIEYVISTEKRDRHKTIVKLDRWTLDNFNNNGIVGYQHDVYGGGMCNDTENPDKVLGEGKAWPDNEHQVRGAEMKGALIGSVRFEPESINPLAEKIFRKTLYGTLKSTSVGFAETKDGDFGKGDEARGKANQTYYYGEQDLLEFSIVNIPSNVDARLRGMRDQTANYLNFIRMSIGSGMTTPEMLKMTVAEVLELVENPEARTALIGGEIIDNEQEEKELGDNLAESILLDQDQMEMDL